MIEAKKIGGVSDVYLNDLRYRLGMFADSFQCDLVSLTPDDMQSFFDRIKLSARSFNNFLRTLKTFCRFAQDRGWLSKEVDLLSSVKRRKEKSTPVEILTPQEMAALMEHATPEIATCFALGAFAGLRSEEILRLEWADVTRRPGFIEVAAHKAKTAARRLVTDRRQPRSLALGHCVLMDCCGKTPRPCFTRLAYAWRLRPKLSGNRMCFGIRSLAIVLRRFRT